MKVLERKSNVECIWGNSSVELFRILSWIEEPVIFWLDAHWGGGDATYGENGECPLIDELIQIHQWWFDRKEEIPYFIFIDDARFFLSPPPPPHQWEKWPDICQITERLWMNDRVLLYGDVLVVFDRKYEQSIIPYYVERR
jgi:hypothetical protein